jgi:hypothetical protein
MARILDVLELMIGCSPNRSSGDWLSSPSTPPSVPRSSPPSFTRSSAAAGRRKACVWPLACSDVADDDVMKLKIDLVQSLGHVENVGCLLIGSVVSMAQQRP